MDLGKQWWFMSRVDNENSVQHDSIDWVRIAFYSLNFFEFLINAISLATWTSLAWRYKEVKYLKWNQRKISILGNIHRKKNLNALSGKD